VQGERTRVAAERIGLACLVLLCAAALWRAPLAVSRLGSLAGESSRLDYADREIAGGNGIIIDQGALYEARAIIPPGARYRILVGSRLQNATSLSETFAPLYYGYFLLPRRQSAGAPWIVCFGCDLAASAPGAQTLWSGENGISVARAAP
jgi:hypothetical protein